MPTAVFCFQASPLIGAGHAIRCSVIADILLTNGWRCFFVTRVEGYNIIPRLRDYERIEPENFYEKPFNHDLLVVDDYNLDISFESYFRPYCKKIMVIDDLANRHHDCDILLDQTYGRIEDDYKDLVPPACKILVGSDYILLRPEFFSLRQRALQKRRVTIDIKRILISMGGNDSKNFTLNALELIKESGFEGAIDIALGFVAPHLKNIQKFTEGLLNECNIYINADMPQLICNADLAIGAAGSSVWERCCLGLPSVLFVTASNQEFIYKSLISKGCAFTSIQEAFSYFKKPEKYFGFSERISNLVTNPNKKTIYRALEI